MAHTHAHTHTRTHTHTHSHTLTHTHTPLLSLDPYYRVVVKEGYNIKTYDSIILLVTPQHNVISCSPGQHSLKQNCNIVYHPVYNVSLTEAFKNLSKH